MLENIFWALTKEEKQFLGELIYESAMYRLAVWGATLEPDFVSKLAEDNYDF